MGRAGSGNVYRTRVTAGKIRIQQLFMNIYDKLEDAVSEDHTMLMKAYHRMLCTNE